MKRMISILSLIAVAAIVTPVHAQRDFSGVQIKTTHVAGNVYMLEGSGGNIGVSVGADGLLIIDDQFAPLADKIQAALKNLNDGDLKFVLNTHHHGDHTGGNPHFGKDASIIAHANVRKRLASGSGSMTAEGLPIITFDASLSVFFNGEEIRVIHVPHGHTDGDSVIYFTQSGVVHMGDQFFNGRFPYIDLDSGGSVEGYMKNVGDIIQKLSEDVKIIPGHGSLGTIEDLKKFNGMLEETVQIVHKGMTEEKSLQQLQDAGLPEKWNDWGTGFIDEKRWIAIIHNSKNRAD